MLNCESDFIMERGAFLCRDQSNKERQEIPDCAKALRRKKVASAIVGLFKGGLTGCHRIEYDDSLSVAADVDQVNLWVGVFNADLWRVSNWFNGIGITVGLPIPVNPSSWRCAVTDDDSFLTIAQYLLVPEIMRMITWAQNGR